jgi:hypothetical protein
MTALDVLDSIRGTWVIATAFLTPFLRGRRRRWGLATDQAVRLLPGDELVPRPCWSYTHAIEIDAPTTVVWPWIAQIGVNKAGFYSYQWLENLAGSRLRNSETVHPEWEVRQGQQLLLHPRLPPLGVVDVKRNLYFVAHAPVTDKVQLAGKPWVTSSWLFLIEPLGPERCRLVSSFRTACSSDLATRLSFGPTLIEPISFAMDCRMLEGVKERAERAYGREHAA